MAILMRAAGGWPDEGMAAILRDVPRRFEAMRTLRQEIAMLQKRPVVAVPGPG